MLKTKLCVNIYTAAGAQGRLPLMPQWHIHYFELKLLDKQPVGKKFIKKIFF